MNHVITISNSIWWGSTEVHVFCITKEPRQAYNYSGMAKVVAKPWCVFSSCFYCFFMPCFHIDSNIGISRKRMCFTHDTSCAPTVLDLANRSPCPTYPFPPVGSWRRHESDPVRTFISHDKWGRDMKIICRRDPALLPSAPADGLGVKG